MVLPSRNEAVSVPQTPDRQAFYQAGKGNILSHFAGLATPDASGNVSMGDPNGVQLRQRRSGGLGGSHPFGNDSSPLVGSSTSTATATATSPVDNNQHTDSSNSNVIATSDEDHVMEDASGAPSGGKQPREVALSLWKLERQQESENGRKRHGVPRSSNSSAGPRSSRSKSISSREIRGPGMMDRHYSADENGHSHQEDNSNNQSESGSMFSMHISPPRHQGPSSRRPTLEADPSAVSEKRLNRSNGSSRGRRVLNGVVLDASFSSDSFSLLSSMEFLSRDLEEEERASKSKSDKERAFLYKKRYMDAYGLAVGLSRRVFELESSRSNLRGSNTASDFAGSHVDERRIESLCQDVDSLSKELRERDSMIASLHSEQRESVRTLNELRLSQAALGSSEGVSPSHSSEVQKTYVAQLEEQLVRMQRENASSSEQINGMGAKISDVQHQLETAHAERVQIENSMRQTEQQLESVHTQWLKEKSDLLETMDDAKKRLHSDSEKLRRENAQLKKAVQQSRETERQLRKTVDGVQRTAEEAKHYNSSLEAQLQEAQARIASFGETQAQLKNAQEQLQRTRHELHAAVGECDYLRRELSNVHQQLDTNNAQFRERMQKLEGRIYQAEIVRRSLHNKVMELKGNIRVFCRVRPVLRHEVAANVNQEIFTFPDYTGERRQIELIAGPRSHVGYGQNGGRETVKKYPFDFDLVFNGACSQDDVFLEVSALVQSALDGYNVCIFAYGQTGSGKTYTMQGISDVDDMEPSPHMGIVGRAISHIYATIEDLRSSGWDFGVSLEMIEIYNETLRDLLAQPGSTDKVDLRLDSDGKPMVANSCVHPMEDEHAAWKLLEKALGRRSTKMTNMNDHSSRSHCVISFRLSGVNSLTGDRRSSVVHLVDLAGSERLSKSGSGNDRDLLKETQCINKSLSALGNVICALAKKSAHVPFRDSKLTHFLSPSLGGDSKTLMICNLSPLQQHREETLNSLRFAKTVNSCEIAFPSYGSRS